MSDIITIGNTQFNKEVISKMSLKTFEKTYKDILKIEDLEAVYKQIKGKTEPS